MKTIKNIFYFIAATFIISNTSFAQTSVSGGADFVSRYVWRGVDFGNSASIQPGLTITSGGFEAGLWGSYPFTTASDYGEMDLYASYEVSDFSLLVTDYYFPAAGVKYGNYKDPGSHTIEIGLSYGGSENFPLSVSAYMNVYNDEDNTAYFELGYSTNVSDVDLNLFVGGTPGGDAGFYGTTNFNLINIGITATKDIKITDDYSLPIFSSYILNPNAEIAYLVFGINLSM